MPKGRIRIRLKSYDHRLVDETCQKIVDTALKTGASVKGPIPLPSKKEVFVVNKSPFIEKNSRDFFGLKTHKRLLDIRSVQLVAGELPVISGKKISGLATNTDVEQVLRYLAKNNIAGYDRASMVFIEKMEPHEEKPL